MAIFRCVSPNFWTDPKVDDDFTPEDKYFYLYLLTNPHTSLSGCYELGKKQASRELGYNEDVVDRLIRRMEIVHGVIRYDKTTKEVLLLNWHKYNWSKSPKCLKGVEYSLKNIKCPRFRQYCIDTLSIQYQYSMDTTVSVSVTDNIDISNTKRLEEDIPEVIEEPTPEAPKKKKFVPPKIEDVKVIFAEKGATPAQAEQFFAYYESNGWRVGKNPMKNWKAAAAGWVSRDRERCGQKSSQVRAPGRESTKDQLARVLANMDKERGFER